MIPVARDGFMGTIDMLFDRKSFNSNKVSSVYDAFIRFQKAVKTGMQVASGEQNKDWIDLLRESTKATNAITGTSDTATDAAFTTLRYIDSDFDAEIGEYLKAIAFDKKLE
jgi:hypothetical protein